MAFANETARERIWRLLESEGCRPSGCFFTGADVIRMVHKLGTAAVVCGFKLRDMTADELAASLRNTAELLVVSTPEHLDFCEGENLFKLASPMTRSDFFASLDIIRHLEETQLRPADDARKSDVRNLVERAKAILMDVNRMTENDAHRFLQKRSMDTGLRISETAQLIIDHYLR